MQTGVQTLIGPWTYQFSRTLVSSPIKGPNNWASLKGLGPVQGLEVGEGVEAGCEVGLGSGGPAATMTGLPGTSVGWPAVCIGWVDSLGPLS